MEYNDINVAISFLRTMQQAFMPPIFLTICANLLYCVSRSLTSRGDVPVLVVSDSA